MQTGSCLCDSVRVDEKCALSTYRVPLQTYAKRWRAIILSQLTFPRSLSLSIIRKKKCAVAFMLKVKVLCFWSCFWNLLDLRNWCCVRPGNRRENPSPYLRQSKRVYCENAKVLPQCERKDSWWWALKHLFDMDGLLLTTERRNLKTFLATRAYLGEIPF